MNIEIEAKIALHDDVAALEARLDACGATYQRTLMEINTFFDTADRRLKTVDEGLRLRVAETDDGLPPVVTITHKGPRAHGKLKNRSEHEVNVQDAHDAASVLVALGYQPVLSFEKRRRQWELDGCEVDIDEMPYIGQFLEIEGPSEQLVMAVREKLGMADEPIMRASYIALLTTYLAEHRIADDHIRLDPTDQPAPAASD